MKGLLEYVTTEDRMVIFHRDDVLMIAEDSDDSATQIYLKGGNTVFTVKRPYAAVKNDIHFPSRYLEKRRELDQKD